jgi:murein DD-endopeptidase MepM/ murein hydrolase activator NlpD
MKPVITKTTVLIVASLAVLISLLSGRVPDVRVPAESPPALSVAEASTAPETSTVIKGEIGQGETLAYIFDSNGLSPEDLALMVSEARKQLNLARLRVGAPYSITADAGGRLMAFTYQPDGERVLRAERDENGFDVSMENIPFEKRIAHIGGVIRSSLVSSMGDITLALELSDIFAWDIDFATGLRQGDSFKAVVEALYLDGEFVRYGRVLAAEFTNDGERHRAFRFTPAGGTGRAGYFDEKGRSLRRSFLKAPLSYRRISSGFTRSRFHPILKKFRPHLGVDYSAPSGTPVSAVGDGRVSFAGYKGVNGNLVIIKHAGSYTTTYGHLKKIARGVRKGKRVRQGQVIGWVGSTGRATGPHLDYRVKRSGRFVNPLRLVTPRERSVPKANRDSYADTIEMMEMRLAAIETGEALLARADGR